MIRPSQRALGQDALYQVLDNGVFRILAAIALVPILIFTLVQITPTELRLLFGVWSWPLKDVGRMVAPEGTVDLQAAAIGTLLDVVFFSLAGTFGVLFCLAATAFFVPRMLEKGAADVLFHKPISRLRFYLSRYVAGLLFVFLLALVSATGVFLALTLVSGFSDPGVFAIVPALTYLFGLIFPVTMLVGVLTRSTVPAILLSGLFFMGNGCIHTVWIVHETDVLAELGNTDSPDEPRDTPTPNPTVEVGADATVKDTNTDSVTLELEGESPLWRRLWLALDVAHFVLPKTSAVPFLTAKLRRAAARPLWADTGSALKLGSLPEGWAPAETGSADSRGNGTAIAAFQDLGPAVLEATGPDGAALSLCLRPARTVTKTRRNGTVRERPERYGEAGQALLEALATAPGVEQAREVPFRRTSRLGNQPNGPQGDTEPMEEPRLSLPFFAELYAWSEPDRANGATHARALVFKNGESIGTLIVYTADQAPVDATFQEIVSKIGYGDPEQAYGRLLRTDAPWRTNIILSIASSILFAALVLGLGAWRLSRIDF